MVGLIWAIADCQGFAIADIAHVINMSLGGGGESQAMNEAIAYAHQKGDASTIPAPILEQSGTIWSLVNTT